MEIIIVTSGITIGLWNGDKEAGIGIDWAGFLEDGR